MKVIKDIISYLSNEQLLTDDQLAFLEEKEYTREEHYDDDYDYHSSYDEEEARQLAEIQELMFEESLRDSRKRKQGRRGKNTPGESKRNKPTRQTYHFYIITEKTLAKVKGHFPHELVAVLQAKKGVYYSCFETFEQDLKAELDHWKVAQFAAGLFPYLKHSFDLSVIIKEQPYLTKKAHSKLKKLPYIVPGKALETHLEVAPGRTIAFSNKFGKLLLSNAS